MGLFDLFGNKKKERERQEQLRLQKEEETRRKAEEQRRQSQERQREVAHKRQEQTRREETILANFNFDSNCHQRYEGDNPVMGLQECPRSIKIRKNISGCSGYQLKNGDGYILTATNGDTGKPQFAAKPMRIVKFSDAEILLRGYAVSAQTPFGWQDIDLSDYGFSIIFKNRKPEKCILYMYDRNVRLEYRIRENNANEIPNKRESAIIKPSVRLMPTDEAISETLENIASQCNIAFNFGNEKVAISSMNELFKTCYGRNGHKLLQISTQATQPIGLAFTNISLFLDFNDENLNSVAAENATYCLGRNLIETSNSFVAPSIFTILLEHRNLLKDKLIAAHCEISQKRVGMPIGIMLGGNPFSSPQLKEFREQAVNEKGIAVMTYLLSFFYLVCQ